MWSTGGAPNASHRTFRLSVTRLVRAHAAPATSAPLRPVQPMALQRLTACVRAFCRVCHPRRGGAGHAGAYLEPVPLCRRTPARPASPPCPDCSPSGWAHPCGRRACCEARLLATPALLVMPALSSSAVLQLNASSAAARSMACAPLPCRYWGAATSPFQGASVLPVTDRFLGVGSRSPLPGKPELRGADHRGRAHRCALARRRGESSWHRGWRGGGRPRGRWRCGRPGKRRAGGRGRGRRSGAPLRRVGRVGGRPRAHRRRQPAAHAARGPGCPPSAVGAAGLTAS